MSCPKCSSTNIQGAPDENPGWAKVYMKCFACGKRWDAAGLPPREERDEVPRAPVTRSSDDLVALVMKVAKQEKSTPKAEPITKETTMARCTKGRCEEDAAADSVRCPKHRDMQKLSNAKAQGRALPDVSVPKRKYTKRQPLGGGTAQTAVATMPAKRAAASIVLAEPHVINPTMNGHGLTMALSGLADVIGKYEADLAMLRGAKALLERHE